MAPSRTYVRRPLAALAALTVLAGLPACSVFGESASVTAARAFLRDWAAGDYAAAAANTDGAPAAKAFLASTATQLGVRPTVTVGPVTEKDGVAAAKYTVTWPLDKGKHPWRYAGTLRTASTDNGDRVHWSPAVIHPALKTGDRLRSTTSLPTRAALTDRDGKSLYAETPVVEVGIQPKAATDPTGLANTLATTLAPEGVVAADILRDVKRAKPTDFVPVITLRGERYSQVKTQIYDLPGTRFRFGKRMLAVDKSFAPALLGRVGPATAEVLKENHLGSVIGDLGTSGLQRALNDRLGGTPGTVVARVASSGSADTLARFGGSAGKPVRLTLDPGVQKAAQSALGGVKQNAAIVAVRPSTGELLAVAQTDAVSYDIGLNGKYPPGSTFKIITAAALLQSGPVTESSTVECPGTKVIGGKRFINENSFDLGSVPLRTAFAKSCNTTFGGLATKLPAGALGKAAGQFGVGADWQLPVSSRSGAVPPPADSVELAADAIGQGKVEVSPLTMALVAATVQRGSVPTPSLIAGEAGKPKIAPAALPASVLPALRDMTRAVVTEGTAASLKNHSGLAGKTGTAEYGTDTPPRTHSWFAGYRGDLAFAVFVEDGASTGQTAYPLSGKFLTALG